MDVVTSAESMQEKNVPSLCSAIRNSDRNVPHLVMKADNEFENFLVVERYNSVKEVPDQNATDWRLSEWANPSHEAPKEA